MAYADLEASLGELERCRAIYELAISQATLDLPETLWKVCTATTTRKETPIYDREWKHPSMSALDLPETLWKVREQKEKNTIRCLHTIPALSAHPRRPSPQA